jgi:gamma-glutamylcyclotransferase (GGCT)/AIG2-like uncharacterized protein YtfP
MLGGTPLYTFRGWGDESYGGSSAASPKSLVVVFSSSSNTSARMNLFAYGTLMFSEVWERVAGRPATSHSATLAGYAVYTARGDVYPVMVRTSANDIVQGIAYVDLDTTTIARLDEYESELYDRIAVEATLADGRSLCCEAYVLPGDRRQSASTASWDRARFERDELARYLARL